jgi:hypothetical protein
MKRQMIALAAIAGILASGALSQAQEFVGTPPPAAPCQGCHAQHHHFSLASLCSWLTYRPTRVPHTCECRMCQLTPTPPLYMYFIGEYGPRSPSLGYPTWDHGFAMSGPEHCGH